MPIEIDEAFINRVIGELRAIRLTVADALGGGDGGTPLNALEIVPGSTNWSTSSRVRTAVRTAGTSIDQRLVALADQLERYASGLDLYLAESDRVESLNSANAAGFASRFSGTAG